MPIHTHVLIRIIAAVLCSWLMVSAGVLLRFHQQTRDQQQQQAHQLAYQLEMQWTKRRSGLGQSRVFPDFEFWRQSGHDDQCLIYQALTGEQHSACVGAVGWLSAPYGFVQVYRYFFDAGQPVSVSVSPQGQSIGRVILQPGIVRELAHAWQTLFDLSQLALISILSVCLMGYYSIYRALQPGRQLVAALKNQPDQQPMPEFVLAEWQCIAAAINELRQRQQQLLDERQSLIVQLLAVQEQERQQMARELHDEFGQCLAAINAHIAGIQQTARLHCPQIVEETLPLVAISQHMLVNIRQLLDRLRPLQLDELGLTVSLQSLVQRWQQTQRGRVDYRLTLSAELAALESEQQVVVLRIVQEALTNAARHAQATRIEVGVAMNDQQLEVVVSDNGMIEQLPVIGHHGLGLLGIRERAHALGGELTLAINHPQGLRLRVCLPLTRSGLAA